MSRSLSTILELKAMLTDRLNRIRRTLYLIDDEFSAAFDSSTDVERNQVLQLISEAKDRPLSAWLRRQTAVPEESMSGRQIRSAAKSRNLHDYSRRHIEDLRRELILLRDKG